MDNLPAQLNSILTRYTDNIDEVFDQIKNALGLSLSSVIQNIAEQDEPAINQNIALSD